MTLARICLAALFITSTFALPQTADVHAKPLTDTDINLMRQDLQSAKDDIIKNTMQFTPAESEAFWPVYREYAREQHSLADNRFRLITEYATNLDKMGDDKAKSLTERMFQVDDKTQALRKTYFPRFVSALGARRAAKFYQVDNRLTMMTNVQLASEIPLIP